MRSKLFTLASTLSLLLCLALTALLVRSWFVCEHLASATNSGPAWVVGSFHGRITFEHRSFWDAQGGFTWGRRRVSFYENPAQGRYQTPTRNYGLFDAGFFSGTAYTWPGHLYPTVARLPATTDPRYWRDYYSAVVIPDLLPIVLFAILPLIYIRKRLRIFGSEGENSVSRTLTALAGLSVLLLLCLTDLWFRSYASGDIWLRVADGHAKQLALYRNQVHLTFGSYDPSAPRNETGSDWRHVSFSPIGSGLGPWPPPRNFFERTGFAYNTLYPGYGKFHHIALPLWPLWVLSTVLPIRWLLAHRRLRRRHIRQLRGQCLTCGYNLTDNTSGVCPECGTAVAVPHRSTAALSAG